MAIKNRKAEISSVLWAAQHSAWLARCALAQQPRMPLIGVMSPGLSVATRGAQSCSTEEWAARFGLHGEPEPQDRIQVCGRRSGAIYCASLSELVGLKPAAILVGVECGCHGCR